MRTEPERTSLARWLALGLGAVAAAGLALARVFPDLTLRLAHCPLRDSTGLPCPTCGGTHAAVALAAGDWAEAWRANPLVTAAVVAFVLWIAWAAAALAVPRLRVRVVLTAGEKKAARIGAALLLIATWLWEILRLGVG